jgi:hypothetical protein
LDLHPTLAALFVVLDDKGDLGDITKTHPERDAFKYFNPFAEFPTDISGLLPREGRWWEDLGE